MTDRGFSLLLIDELDRVRERHSCPDLARAIDVLSALLDGPPEGWRVTVR